MGSVVIQLYADGCTPSVDRTFTQHKSVNCY